MKSCYTGRSVVFLIVLAQTMAFFFLYEAGYLESERRLLEREKEELRKERERLEIPCGDICIPQCAFWVLLLLALDCCAYGKREYHAVLQNAPEDWTEMDVCTFQTKDPTSHWGLALLQGPNDTTSEHVPCE